MGQVCYLLTVLVTYGGVAYRKTFFLDSLVLKSRAPVASNASRGCYDFDKSEISVTDWILRNVPLLSGVFLKAHNVRMWVPTQNKSTLISIHKFQNPMVTKMAEYRYWRFSSIRVCDICNQFIGNHFSLALRSQGPASC